MDLELSEEQKMLKKAAHEFLQKEIVPIAEEYDRTYHPLPKELAKDLMKRLVPLGFLSGLVPEEYGGMGLDYISNGILVEEAARAYSSLAFIAAVHQKALLPALCKYGTEKQRAKFCAPAMSGDAICAIAGTEPDVGSGARDMRTAAVLDGDSYIINGTKTWITNGTIADVVCLLASTDRSKGARGISCFIVEKEVSDFSVRELHKLGFRSLPTGELIFEDCRVPKENLLGGLGEGYHIAIEDFYLIRASMAMIAVGLAQAAIDASVRYARERKQFGRPIAKFQLIQELIADMAIETEAARWLTYRAYEMLGKGINCRKECSMAKAYATTKAIDVTSKAIQIHGAYGISDEHPLEQYFRDARSLTFPDGTTEIQKLVIGREVLNIAAFV